MSYRYPDDIPRSRGLKLFSFYFVYSAFARFQIVPIRTDWCGCGTAQRRINTRFSITPHGFESHNQHHRFARKPSKYAAASPNVTWRDFARRLRFESRELSEANYCAAVAFGGKCSSR